MATFERTHEFGMLLALGTAPARIVGMILLESLALGVTGALLGTALGGALVALGAPAPASTTRTLTGGGPSQLSAFGMSWSLRSIRAWRRSTSCGRWRPSWSRRSGVGLAGRCAPRGCSRRAR